MRSNSNRDIYEERLQIPMLKLLSAGKVDETFVSIIRQNNRVPEQVWAIFGRRSALAG